MRKLTILLLITGLLFSLAACSEPGASLVSVAPATPSPTVGPTPTPTPSPSPTPEPTPEGFGLPNVYLFVLDEFSSFDMLSKYYDYNAKDFSDFLTTNGFNISRESYCTDNQTEHSFCDLLNLKYISRRYSDSKCNKAIAAAKLYDVFADLGYSQFQLSSSNGHFIGIPSLKSNAGKEAYAAITTGKDFKGSAPVIPDALTEQLSKSKFGTKPSSSNLNKWGFYSSDYIRSTKAYKSNNERKSANNILNIFDYLENPDNYAPTSPRVIYSYMPATHVPFVFNEYGGILPNRDERDWKDEDVYLGQYRFINKRFMATVSTIIANDPDSIIIIMSDHGIRYHADCLPLIHKFYIPDKDSLRIMNAVYVKGQKYDIEGLSAINTLRYILSLYEGHEQDYPPIKDPITSKSPKNLSGIIPRHRAPYVPPAPTKTPGPTDGPGPTEKPTEKPKDPGGSSLSTSGI